MSATKPARRAFKSGTTLEDMLKVKTFEQLLADGDVLDVQGAARQVGYAPKHIHRLCREHRIDHITRGLPSNPAEVHFFFLAWQLRGLFIYKKARA